MGRQINYSQLPSPPLALLELATSYQRAKTLFALVEFELPTLLAQRGPLSREEIARELRIHPRACDRFLRACVALELLMEENDLYRNTETAQIFLAKDGVTYLGEQIANYARTSDPLWTDLSKRLRAWQPGESENQTSQEEDQGAKSLSAQHNLAVLTGSALGRVYDFSSHRKALDLGGGTGAMAIGICGIYKHLRAIVFDLPDIAAIARDFVGRSKMDDRIEVIAGDFRADALPATFDVALLANFLSVAGEDTNRRLFRRIYDALPDDGVIILSGWMLNNDRTSPLLAALFCLEDINWEAPDVERTVSTYRSWLKDAGFGSIEHRDVAAPTSMVVARKRI